MPKQAPTEKSYDDRPNLAADLASAACVCVSLPDLSPMTPSWSSADVVAAVCEALRERTGDREDIVVGAIISFMSRRLSELSLLPGADQRSISRCQFSIRSGQTSSDLRRAYQGAHPAGDLAATSAVIRDLGIDAKALEHAVIVNESCKHLGLVWHKALRMAKSYPNHTAEDLFGWGWQGLLAALRKYDPSRFKFSTYAATRIVGCMKDGVRQESPVPKRLNTWMRDIDKREAELAQGLGRSPRLDELAAHTGEDLSKLAIIARLKSTASLEELTASPSGRAAVEAELGVGMDLDPVDEIIRRDEQERLQRDVQEALDELSPMDAQIIRMLWMENETMAEVRKVTGLDNRKLKLRSQRGLAALEARLVEHRPDVSAGENRALLKLISQAS